MVLLNGYPSVAKFIHINTSYSTTDNTDVHFESGTLIFDSFNPENPERLEPIEK